MRSRIVIKASAAWRISTAPSTLKNGTGRPLPKPSAAAANRRSDFTWLRRKTVATASSTSDEPTIHITKM